MKEKEDEVRRKLQPEKNQYEQYIEKQLSTVDKEKGMNTLQMIAYFRQMKRYKHLDRNQKLKTTNS